MKPCAFALLRRLCTVFLQAGGNGSATKRERREKWRRQSPPMRWQQRFSHPHSRGWTGGSVDAVFGVEGPAVGVSVWLRCAGGLSLTCELGPAPEALCPCWVALDRLEPRERVVNGLVI